MNLTQLAAFVALIVDDTQRRFGEGHYTARHDAYAGDAVLDLWLTRPDVTVADADEVLSQVRCELGQRAIDGERHDQDRQFAIAQLQAEPAQPSGHCPNQQRESDGDGAARPAAESSHPESDRWGRGGALAAR